MQMTLFLQNPNKSLSEVINIINTYSKLSDYLIYWNKSTILPLCQHKWNITPQNPHILPHHRQYHISRYKNVPRLSELLQLNFTPLLKTIEDDLNHWMTLPLSIMDRISTVKMMILPKNQLPVHNDPSLTHTQMA